MIGVGATAATSDRLPETETRPSLLALSRDLGDWLRPHEMVELAAGGWLSIGTLLCSAMHIHCPTTSIVRPRLNLGVAVATSDCYTDAHSRMLKSL
jgi:hypothetical protein